MLFTSEELGQNGVPVYDPWQVKKSLKLILCGAYYLTVSVYTKTIIHLGVSG